MMELELEDGQSRTLVVSGWPKGKCLVVANIGQKLFFREKGGAILGITVEDGVRVQEVAARLTRDVIPEFRPGAPLPLNDDGRIFTPASKGRTCVYVEVHPHGYRLVGGSSIIGGVKCADLMRKINM